MVVIVNSSLEAASARRSGSSPEAALTVPKLAQQCADTSFSQEQAPLNLRGRGSGGLTLSCPASIHCLTAETCDRLCHAYALSISESADMPTHVASRSYCRQVGFRPDTATHAALLSGCSVAQACTT